MTTATANHRRRVNTERCDRCGRFVPVDGGLVVVGDDCICHNCEQAALPPARFAAMTESAKVIACAPVDERGTWLMVFFEAMRREGIDVHCLVECVLSEFE